MSESLKWVIGLVILSGVFLAVWFLYLARQEPVVRYDVLGLQLSVIEDKVRDLRDHLEELELGPSDLPVYWDAVQLGQLTDAQSEAIRTTVELNKYIISIVSLLFGAVGFYLKQYADRMDRVVPALAFLFALVLLGLTYWYAFQTYAEVTSDLAQNVIALTPGKSRVLHYLGLEARAAALAAMILLGILIYGFIRRR